ncbi:unnamed protein product [Lactuca virosa]|uniref:Uncharacterized protein n=1 Tax=Lactuca virosa TaxID=75947 RepID=A0AAU9NDD5_9ASTR|nr:unnamed protein product [Lactuca virosa]
MKLSNCLPRQQKMRRYRRCRLSPSRYWNHRLRPDIIDYDQHAIRISGEYFTGDEIIVSRDEVDNIGDFGWL